MSVKVASNRFILPSIAKSAAFYQRINASVFDFHKLGAWLSSHAQNLQAYRQTEKLKTVAEVLSNLPLQEYTLKGQYYLAWRRYRKGRDTRSEFELVVEKSESLREKALISLAALEIAKKDYSMAIKNYQEAIKWAKTPTTTLAAARSLAVYKADHGDHEEALKELLTLYPLSRYTEPKTYYDYLNSLTVELSEAGEHEAARETSRIVLASPFAFAYPEWRETANEIALRGYKSRSVVSVLKPVLDSDNVVPMPERESSGNPHSATFGPAPVVSLKGWKDKMVKELNGEDENVDQMDFNELIVKLLQITACEEASEEKLKKVVKSAIEIMKD